MKITVTDGRKIMGRLPKAPTCWGPLEEQCRVHGITLGEVRLSGR